MLEGIFQPTHLLLIFLIALLIFWPQKASLARQGHRCRYSCPEGGDQGSAYRARKECECGARPFKCRD